MPPYFPPYFLSADERLAQLEALERAVRILRWDSDTWWLAAADQGCQQEIEDLVEEMDSSFSPFILRSQDG